MVHFVIAGRPDCKNFVQVKQTAIYLAEHLPCFDYKKIELPAEDWSTFLIKINREHGWHHGSSPLVYKEVHRYGTNTPVLIGGASEFWEYCYDYYGLESKMSREELEQLTNENIFWMNKEITDEENANKNAFQIMVYGAMNSITQLFLPELLRIEGMSERMRILLYDENLDVFNMQYFEDFNDEFKDMFGIKSYYCDNLAEGLRDCDLLVMVDDTSDLSLEGDEARLQNYLLQICFLTEEINMCAKRSLKIVLANNGISCFIATVMARKLVMPSSQIVVVASDLGLGYLGEMSRRLDVAPRKMCAPPVWGFIGLNEFVDAGSTLIKCKIYKPYPRAIRATKGSTLTHGTIHCELRFINYLSDDLKDLKETVDKRRESIKEKLQRAPLLAKLEALINLIKIWCGCTPLKDPIISLGILSDGSFGIPENLIFAQPAVQYRNGWVPYSNYPVPDHILEVVGQAGDEAYSHYEKFSTGTVFRRATSQAYLKHKQSRQFGLLTAQDINSEPVINSDVELVDYTSSKHSINTK